MSPDSRDTDTGLFIDCYAYPEKVGGAIVGQIRVVLLFNEENERQKEIGEYVKSQKRCKTALITELVYAWLHKESGAAASYNNESIDIEEVKRQLLHDVDFLQPLKEIASAENNKKKQREEDSELDIDEELMMVGLEMFENNF